jgi:hypothetical protein
MSLREAAQQALEALERGRPVAYVSGVYAGHFTVVPTNPALVLTTGMALYTHPVDDTALLRQAWEALRNDDIQQRMKAITALRERLEGKA